MATQLFVSAAGSVMRIAGEGVAGAFTMKFSPLADVASLGGIITSTLLTGDTNVQFMQTLGNDIFITVFGDKMGSMTVSGMLFLNTPALCDPKPTGTGGIEKFLKFFYDNYVGRRKEPLEISLGNKVIKAFLLSFQMQITDAQFMLGQFTMQMAALPKG